MDKDLMLLRSIYKDNCIWYMFRFDDKNLFLLSGNKEYLPNDINTCMVYVDNGKIKIYDILEESKNKYINAVSYKKSLDNKIFIDITREQFEKGVSKASSL